MRPAIASMVSILAFGVFATSVDDAQAQRYSGQYVQLAQATVTEARLRTVIAELQSGQPNYERMEPALRIAVRQQIEAIGPRLKGMGALQSIKYEGPQQGADVYEVRFANGVTVWMIGLAPNGNIAVLYFQ